MTTISTCFTGTASKARHPMAQMSAFLPWRNVEGQVRQIIAKRIKKGPHFTSPLKFPVNFPSFSHHFSRFSLNPFFRMFEDFPPRHWDAAPPGAEVPVAYATPCPVETWEARWCLPPRLAPCQSHLTEFSDEWNLLRPKNTGRWIKVKVGRDGREEERFNNMVVILMNPNKKSSYLINE